jgi:uncharacterized membrane protein
LQRTARYESVDALRGLVMVVMALDHVRFFLHRDVIQGIDPLDLTRTTPLLFMTRWITHLCAPVFVFLAGTGARLSLDRGRSKGGLARFLWARGAWLILLDLTVVRFGWTFHLDTRLIFAVVLWALGWSMVILGGLILLPEWIAPTFGILLIALHNLFDGVSAADLGAFRWVWIVLHSGGSLSLTPESTLVIVYPLIPWIGVMAAGYGFGALLSGSRDDRRRRLLRLGLALCALFVIIRSLNVYGDPNRWSAQTTWVGSCLSFINCEKYPPSLSFLLMTLGPAIALMALFDRAPRPVQERLAIFGRVPLFYYLIHFPVIHLAAIALSFARYGRASWLFTNPPWSPALMSAFPRDYGYGLGVVYAVWLGTLLLLFPACRWFADLKRRRREYWLSYL